MLSLDHVIWTGNNIEEISERYGQDFAVKSVKGGEHVDWGTYNYLTHLSNNCYLEWLGIRDLQRAENIHHPLIEHLLYALKNNIKGPFQFALRTTKMDDYISHFKTNHIAYFGPIEGKRTKPNGQELSWRMLFPKFDFESQALLPFLIEWDQPEQERIDVSLVNHQAITDIHYSGLTKEDFTKIYNLSNSRIRGNRVKLRNTKIHFEAEGPLKVNLK